MGDADLVLAGGVESMSRAPWVLPKPAKGYPTGHEQLWSTTLGWRMTNPRMPAEWTISLGEGAEVLADKYSISREEQDAFALDSHRQAAAAWEAGWFAAEVVAVEGVELARDECIRRRLDAREAGRAEAGLPRRTARSPPATSSPMNDGASALLASSTWAARPGVEPLARVVSRATSGVEPHLYGIGPVGRGRAALPRAGLTWG